MTFRESGLCYSILTSRGDQRLAHDTGNDVSVETLSSLGVIYHSIPIDSQGEWEGKIDVFAKERGYKNVSSVV